MGFTFSHPALIVPFRYLPQKYYSVSALVVGSMIPDFEYFIRFGSISNYSHTFWGIFWFDLPMAFLVLFLFHQLIRNTLIDNSPDFLRYRLWPYKQFNWPKHFKEFWLVVTCSVLAGIATHLFWDSWTSGSGYFVEKYDVFLEPVHLGNITVLVYQITKNLSSLLGAVVVIYQVLLLPKSKPLQTSRNKSYWPVFFLILLGIVSIQFLVGFHARTYTGLVKKSLASALSALMLVSVIFWKKEKKPS
jgi:hypothetical protein